VPRAARRVRATAHGTDPHAPSPPSPAVRERGNVGQPWNGISGPPGSSAPRGSSRCRGRGSRAIRRG
jgi:hypothetical protein